MREAFGDLADLLPIRDPARFGTRLDPTFHREQSRTHHLLRRYDWIPRIAIASKLPQDGLLLQILVLVLWHPTRNLKEHEVCRFLTVHYIHRPEVTDPTLKNLLLLYAFLGRVCVQSRNSRCN